jgi:hypothetical protein
VCFLEQNSLALFLFLIYSLDFYTKRPQWPSKKKLRQHVKILLKGTLSDLILVWPHTSVYYHFISFFFSFSQCPSLSTKIGFVYFHNRLKNIFFPNRKGGKSPWMEVSIVGDSHTLSLCATLCKRQRNPHTNDGLMCVSFLWVGGCV